MPIYEYECADHGRFDELRSFKESDLPADCPACAAACARIVSLPRLAMLDAGVKHAHERNERSRHEPLRHTGSLDLHPVFRGKAKRGHVCTTACNHGASATERKSQSYQTYTGPRPWVVEHTQGATVD